MPATRQSPRVSAEIVTSRMFAEVFQAYTECSNEVQEVIREMISVVNDSEAAENEREMACSTIAEALFPFRHAGNLGIDLEEAERIEADKSKDVAEVKQTMDYEQDLFSRRVLAALDARGMTQAALADACGVGQSALSNLLSRGNRPQRRTVQKIATALGMPPEDLWPTRS
jgi:lambda repressor-like predicted transcriptional regulator